MRRRWLPFFVLAFVATCAGGERPVKAAFVDRAACEAVVKELLPPEAPEEYIRDYTDALATHVAAPAQLPAAAAQLRALLGCFVSYGPPYSIAICVINGWAADGGARLPRESFKQYGDQDWRYYALTNLLAVLRAYPQWELLLQYAYYRSDAKGPVGLRAYMQKAAARAKLEHGQAANH